MTKVCTHGRDAAFATQTLNRVCFGCEDRPPRSLAESRRGLCALSEKQMSDLCEHERQFNDGRYELFKSTMKYDGDLGREQHNFPSAAELPA